jgi:hypothetical protein
VADWHGSNPSSLASLPQVTCHPLSTFHLPSTTSPFPDGTPPAAHRSLRDRACPAGSRRPLPDSRHRSDPQRVGCPPTHDQSVAAEREGRARRRPGPGRRRRRSCGPAIRGPWGCRRCGAIRIRATPIPPSQRETLRLATCLAEERCICQCTDMQSKGRACSMPIVSRHGIPLPSPSMPTPQTWSAQTRNATTSAPPWSWSLSQPPSGEPSNCASCSGRRSYDRPPAGLP